MTDALLEDDVPVDEDKILLNGEEVSEDEIKDRLRALIKTEKITISCAETRQRRQYEPNNYHESTAISIEGISPFLDSLTVSAIVRKKLSALSLGMLTARVNQMYNFMKLSIHNQQQIDGIGNIDRRPGEIKEDADE